VNRRAGKIDTRKGRNRGEGRRPWPIGTVADLTFFAPLQSGPFFFDQRLDLGARDRADEEFVDVYSFVVEQGAEVVAIVVEVALVELDARGG
jgi:hypothetical protein